MPIKYKIDIMKTLKEAGYTTKELREKFHIGESAVSSMRNGKNISFDVLEKVCKLLHLQPGDIIEHIEN